MLITINMASYWEIFNCSTSRLYLLKKNTSVYLNNPVLGSATWDPTFPFLRFQTTLSCCRWSMATSPVVWCRPHSQRMKTMCARCWCVRSLAVAKPSPNHPSWRFMPCSTQGKGPSRYILIIYWTFKWCGPGGVSLSGAFPGWALWGHLISMQLHTDILYAMYWVRGLGVWPSCCCFSCHFGSHTPSSEGGYC